MIDSFQVVLPVMNEEIRIGDALSHYVKYCSLITVVDNFSTDSTSHILSSRFPGVDVVRLANNGCHETEEWWTSALPIFVKEYILFASCSEFISAELLHLFDAFAKSSFADLFDVPRESITNSQPTNYLYCKPSSLLSKNISYPTVTRLVKWSAIDPTKMRPHDTFRSQLSCTRIVLDSTNPQHAIQHLRPAPTTRTLRKHIAYAKLYAALKCNSNPIRAILDSGLRSLLDTIRIVRAVTDNECNSMVFQEYLLRMLMHLQVVYFAFLPAKAN